MKNHLGCKSKTHLIRGALFSTLCLVSQARAQTLVTKIAEPFEGEAWIADQYNKAGGAPRVSDEAPGDAGAVSRRSMEIPVEFSGTGFEFFSAVPRQPIVVPGVAKKVSLWVRADGQPYAWNLQFRDGWGRTEADGEKLLWEASRGVGIDWEKVSFDIPANWVQPISIVGINTQNWGQDTKKATAHFWADQLQVETDISDVDANGALKSWKPDPNPTKDSPKTSPSAPLLSADMVAGANHNIFSGSKPSFTLRARNWQAKAATGKLTWKMMDGLGTMLKQGAQDVSVEDNASVALPLGVPGFGLYRLDYTLAWNNGKSVQASAPFASVPVPRQLSEAEKDASPYGLNVLAARGEEMVSTFRKAGIVWYRDYGFDYGWMVRAKGADKSYGGWPYYPKIVKTYQDNGVRLLADLKTAIKPPAKGAMGPDAEWTREMIGILTAFPSVTHFELDNEYDLNSANSKAEEATGWRNYGAYHKKFGELANLLGDGKLTTVENGRAGIWPGRLKPQVLSGAFASIQVVNSHHYTGVDPPEVNVINNNTNGGGGTEASLLFFDQLRAAKRAGSADGVARQHWLSEFGWDTKAGPIVTPLQQAAYLPRAFMLMQAAGTEKGFWFFDLDSPDANQFFDGCGLLTWDLMPKMSFASFAGMTQILPKPQYVGPISAGEGTQGYVFRNEGKLVAALWNIEEGKGRQVDFGNAKLYDFFANPITGGKTMLGIAPVYAVGIDESSRWMKQTAYSLETPYLVGATAGVSVTANLQVKNNRATPIKGTLKMTLPQGWSGDATKTISVEAGKTALVPLTFRVDAKEVLGEKTVQLAIDEGAPVVSIPLRVRVEPPVVMTVQALSGDPGKSEVSIRLVNRSAQALNGNVMLKVPSSWSATPQIEANLAPGQSREIKTTVSWTPDWKSGESAVVRYQSVDGRTASQPLIPPRIAIHRASNLQMDGDLKDWNANQQVPDWVLGSTDGAARAKVYLAWSKEGLYVAADVQNSKLNTQDPRSFWADDALELFLDTRDKKTPRAFEAGDHQFWLVPQVEGKRVYVGQWKRGSELPETRYDIAGIQSAAVRRGDGYVMECLIPASSLRDWKPQAGTRLGLNFNLSVRSTPDREVFWTRPKNDGAADHPESWGSALLAQ